MSADLELTRDDELMILAVEGLTDAGSVFVDSFVWPEMVVVDSGRVVLPLAAEEALLAAAARADLTVAS